MTRWRKKSGNYFASLVDNFQKEFLIIKIYFSRLLSTDFRIIWFNESLLSFHPIEWAASREMRCDVFSFNRWTPLGFGYFFLRSRRRHFLMTPQHTPHQCLLAEWNYLCVWKRSDTFMLSLCSFAFDSHSLRRAVHYQLGRVERKKRALLVKWKHSTSFYALLCCVFLVVMWARQSCSAQSYWTCKTLISALIAIRTCTTF